MIGKIIYIGCLLMMLQPLLASVPNFISYQGRIIENNTNFNGNGYFKFLLYSETTTLWSNDDSSTNLSEPNNSVQLYVNNGLFSIHLGDTNKMSMLPYNIFTNSIKLKTWFSNDNIIFKPMSPDQIIGSVAYSLNANNAENITDYIVSTNKLNQQTYNLVVYGNGIFYDGGTNVVAWGRKK